MTKTNKTTKIVSMALFAIVSFASATFADSFVNESNMNALKGFTFGQSVSTVDRTDNTAAYSNQGDSFVNDAAMKALKDFRFGDYDRPSYTIANNTENAFNKGDSFVNANAINTLESMPTIKLSLNR